MPAGYTITGAGRTVRAQRTDEPVRSADGYGGWEITSRPKRAALTTWRGRQPFTIVIPMLLEGWPDTSVEPDIRDLDLLATAVTRVGPPDVRISGVRTLPQRATGVWAIQDLAWGDYLVRADGSKVRQEVAVTLIERNTDKLLKDSTAGAMRAGKFRVQYATVRPGDTLLKIAARELGDGTRWPDIAVLNGLRSSGQLKPGSRLRLP